MHHPGLLPSFVPHFIAPVLVALAFFPTTRKHVLLWSPMVFVPDLDFFFAKDLHRAVLGNIWWPLLCIGSLVLLWRRRDPFARFTEFAWRPGAPVGLTLSAYYLLGHILMDVFVGGVPLFWPLSTISPSLAYAIFVDTATGEPQAVGEAVVKEDIPEISPVFPWLDYDHTAQLAFLAAMVLVGAGWWLWHRRTAPVVVVREASIQKP